MKTRNKKPHSFVYICIINFLIYSFSLLLLYIGANYLQKKSVDLYYYSINELMEDKALRKDQFSKLSIKKYKNMDVLIYDENEKLLYTTSDELGNTFTKEDLEFVNDFYNGKTYYLYTEINDLDTNESMSKIDLYESPDNLSSDTDLICSCILNKEYEKIQGDCSFDSLSDFQISLIRGYYDEKHYIDKYNYETEDGMNRSLLFISPIIDNAYYNQIVQESNRIWVVAAFIAGIIIVVQSYIFTRKIKKMISPLQQIVDAYQNGKEIEMKEDIPTEFAKTIHSYTQLLKNLIEVQAEKEQIYQERQRVIANISHDLKTPLTVIQGYTGAFMDHMVPENKKEQYMQAIYNKTKLAVDLVDSLNEYVRMDHPEYQPNFEMMDINELVKEYLAGKYQEIENNGFLLNFKLSNEKINLTIDKKLILRLLENLMGNAMKYNPVGTQIYVSLQQEENQVILIVADNGVGIPNEIMKQVFDPFVTGNYARKSGQGTGLGLSISKRIVELHKGTIELSDKCDGYATQFKIILPVSHETL